MNFNSALKVAACAFLLAASAACSNATTTPAETAAPIEPTATVNVWPGVAPGSENWTQHEVEMQVNDPPFSGRILRNVVEPTLTVYLPPEGQATGAGVIVAPGGGFRVLAIDLEGHEVARWLAAHGVAAFVLKYRLEETAADDAQFLREFQEFVGRVGAPTTPGAPPAAPGRSGAPIAIADGVQALALVRSRAAEWGVDPHRIGMVGFSAGSGVTIGTLLQPDAAARPNFAAPIYGGLFGPPQTLPADLPPVFMGVAEDDFVIGSSLALFNGLRAAGDTPELHVYASGGHGFGMKEQHKTSDDWINQFYLWMQVQGFLQPTAQ